LLIPKRTKFRRYHRAKLKKRLSKGRIVFGEYGLQALQPAWLTARQIEAARRVITRVVRRTGKIWIRVFPDNPITERAAESRMGSGKGTNSYWVASVTAGAIIFEITGVRESVALETLKKASVKLPIKTCVVQAAAAC
jgi:large subunit ribosomal protein L16